MPKNKVTANDLVEYAEHCLERLSHWRTEVRKVQDQLVRNGEMKAEDRAEFVQPEQWERMENHAYKMLLRLRSFKDQIIDRQGTMRKTEDDMSTLKEEVKTYVSGAMPIDTIGIQSIVDEVVDKTLEYLRENGHLKEKSETRFTTN